MKRSSIVIFLLLFILSCRKDINTDTGERVYMNNVRSILRDSMGTAYRKLDFANISLIQIKDQYFTQIPFENRIVVLETEANGSILNGRIVELITDKRSGSSAFNGNITVQYLSGELMLHSVIKDGYILKFKKATQTKKITPDPTVELPEVIIVSTYSSSTSYITSAWIELISILNVSGNGLGYYSPYTHGTGGGSNGGSGGPYPVSNPASGNIMSVDFETIGTNAITMEKYLKCFDAIPDAGANCSIEIFTDIPVDSDPTKLFNWQNESPGHCFIQLRKQSGSASAVQNIGFYPTQNWKVITTPAPVSGKFVDNAGHEFNASFKMSISAVNFKSIQNYMLYLARFVRYDIDEYNCADLALEIFNLVRYEKLVIPKYAIPGGMAPKGTNTPQGLFQKLKQMKETGHSEAANITFGIVKGWVGLSKGPCN